MAAGNGFASLLVSSSYCGVEIVNLIILLIIAAAVAIAPFDIMCDQEMRDGS